MADLNRYTQHYSPPRFWTKLRRYARAAGREVVQKALCLYYSACAPTTPRWAKAAIAGALGYFIMPLDAVPDVVAVFGYTDDLVVLGVALVTVAAYVTPEHVARAERTMRQWGWATPARRPFGDTSKTG